MFVLYPLEEDSREFEIIMRTNVPAIVYDFKAISGALRKQQLNDSRIYHGPDE